MAIEYFEHDGHAQARGNSRLRKQAGMSEGQATEYCQKRSHYTNNPQHAADAPR